MIEVQIAGTVLEDGVAEMRWVLVDDCDAPAAAAAPTAPAAPAPALPPPVQNAGGGVMLLAKLLVLAGALGGAWALSLAILQARTSARSAIVESFDPTPARALAPAADPATPADQAVALRAARPVATSRTPVARSKP